MMVFTDYSLILYGTELLDHLLSTLFTLMLSHCYAPVFACRP